MIRFTLGTIGEQSKVVTGLEEDDGASGSRLLPAAVPVALGVSEGGGEVPIDEEVEVVLVIVGDGGLKQVEAGRPLLVAAVIFGLGLRASSWCSPSDGGETDRRQELRAADCGEIGAAL